MQNLNQKEIQEIKILIDKQNRYSLKNNLIHISKSGIEFIKLYKRAMDLKNKYISNNLSKNDKDKLREEYLSLNEFSFPIEFFNIKENWSISFYEKESILEDELTRVKRYMRTLEIEKNIDIRSAKKFLKEIQKYIYIGFFEELKPLITEIDLITERVDTNNKISLDNKTHKQLINKDPSKSIPKKRGRKRKTGAKVGFIGIEKEAWDDKVKALVKSEIIRKGLSVQSFVERFTPDLREQGRVYRQISKGDISASLLLKIMDFLRITKLDLDL